MKPVSFISNAEPEYIDSLYQSYKSAPEQLDDSWKRFFDGFDFAMGGFLDGKTQLNSKELHVWNLINAYRKRGHLLSKTNPIRPRKDRKPELALEKFGLSTDDLESTFQIGEAIGIGPASLKDILARLEAVYCGSLGFQYDYINTGAEYDFFQKAVESWPERQIPLSKKQRILEKLNSTVVFEKFLHTKYIGQKRFSLEGGESTIPALDGIINKSAELGVEELVIGMAHRGRLNVLVNIMGKTYEQIFSEFEGNAVPDLTMGDGDVKYHLGYSSEVQTTAGKTVHLKLAPNPSHLEAVGPVVEGFVRAQADILYGSDFNKIMPILIHGDAAIAGQGVCYEVLQMSQLEGYHTGGTLHFVINNQIGFTTDFDDARSSDYCTSFAATVQAPVIHVNGDNVEAVLMAVELAVEYRQKFHKDVFVDMVCYRKHGHNEGDDPKFTQPELYDLIDKHRNPRELYSDALISHNEIEAGLAHDMDKGFWSDLQDRLDMVKQSPLPYHYQAPQLAWKQLRRSTPEDFVQSPDTAVSQARIDDIVKGLMKLPDGIEPLRKVQKMLKGRREQYFNEGLLDWASAELLAYGSILLDGKNIRMSGQDCIRGTFSHRHAIIYDDLNNRRYNRLDNLDKNQQGRFRIYNSLLSEFGVLGFEYGYATASPDSLTIWEAQFGDFSNGAQTIIDQFICSGETKWQRMTGLVMLLPHGYEGQGPEHSSARLERFLQMCAEFNIVVGNITTPANFFHALRRQVAWPFRKPLIVMSPKSLLRHAQCISHVKDFTTGRFQETLVDEFDISSPNAVDKVICCSGKIYYDLREAIEASGRKNIVVCRVEQLYPLPFQQLDELMDRYPKAQKIWVQEEPANAGAWVYLLSCYRNVEWELISRKSSASPATGYYKIHDQEQQDIINRAIA